LPAGKGAVAVGATVHELGAHAGEPVGVRGPVRRDDPADPAHGSESSARP
jgi:hypothetical protein